MDDKIFKVPIETDKADPIKKTGSRSENDF